MTSLRIILLLTVCCIITNCSNTRTVTPQKTEVSYTIDGSISDWNRNETEVENQESVAYYTAYDDDFLYLYITIKSAVKNNQIRQSGYIIYLNHSKETRKKTGIGFPAGSFNLLREDPGAFRSFTSESDWFEDPANREFLTELANDNFKRVMVVERPDGNSSAEYGFVDISQLEIDGMELAYDESRLTSIEMKIPLDGSSVFGITRKNLWLGFAIEPPDFKMDNSNYNVSGQSRNRGMYGSRSNRQPSVSQMRHSLYRNLGQYERWYLLRLQ